MSRPLACRWLALGEECGVVLLAASWDTWEFDKLEVRRHVVG
jgi:hypothetical protein